MPQAAKAYNGQTGTCVKTAGKISMATRIWILIALLVAAVACSTDAPLSPVPAPTSAVANPSPGAAQNPPDPIPVATPTPSISPSPTPTATPSSDKVPSTSEGARPATVEADAETPGILASEDRPILFLDLARTNREESLGVVAVRADGQALGAVAPAPGAVWSPDGSRFAYITGDGVAVRIGGLDGEEVSVLDTGTEWHPMYQWPAWSPDGNLLAAINVAWCEVGMKVSSVEIIDALNGGSVDRHGPYDFWQADGTLQGPRQFSTPNNISWSRDGEKLLVSWDKAVVINIKSGKPRVISSSPVLAEWAPTSDAVYYFEVETGERKKRNLTLGALHIRHLESDEPEVLLTADEVASMGLAAEWGPIPGVLSLSPSGSTLAVSGGGDEDERSELHLFRIREGSNVVSAQDSARYPVSGRLVALDWSPDGGGIAGLIADASGVRMDIFDLAANEWRAAATPGIEVSHVQFLGKTISWSK